MNLLLAILVYVRASFGGWQDVDHDCQDTRAELLIARSLVPVTFTTAKHCYVSTGLWIDEYSGEFIRQAALIDVDHIVPLSEAWHTGADGWNDTQRVAFTNDPAELALTSLHSNRSKGDRTPDLWAPEEQPWRCLYFYRWAQVKVRWGLSATPAEVATVRSCEVP